MTGTTKTIPTIDLKGVEPCPNVTDSDIMKEGTRLFFKHGCLLMNNAFDPGFIQQLHDEYVEEYKNYFSDKKFPDALEVGDKRSMITVEMKGSFNSAELYANIYVYPLLKCLLGSDFILDSLGSVVSLPGSEDQHIHRDYPRLHNESAISQVAPYAITVVIPLIRLDELTGNTRVWPGTHQSAIESSDVSAEDGVDYVADLGSCLLMDYRLIHAGVANKSDQIRPIAYYVYSRPWFRDDRNFSKQEPLVISSEAYASVPENYRHLFR